MTKSHHPPPSEPPVLPATIPPVQPTPAPAVTSVVHTAPSYEAAIDRAWRTLGIVNEWVRFLDGKATAILAADAAITGAVLSFIKGEMPYFNAHGWLYLPLLGMVICLGCSIFKGLYCIAPTLYPGKASLRTMFALWGEPYHAGTEKHSLLYFEHIAGGNADAEIYRAAALSTFSNSETIFSQITQQIYANSIVARDKSVDVGRAIQWLVWALVCGLVAVAIRLLVY